MPTEADLAAEGGEVGPPLVRCTVCGMSKHPWGRDPGIAAANGYCGHDCEGYALDPIPSSLWPGETREEFGYGG